MTASLPEPSYLGPVAGGNFRASDQDREQVLTVLSTAYAEGRLTHDEHDERTNLAMAAKTFDDLIPITHDLVVVAPSAQVPASVAATNRTAYQVETTGGDPEPERMVAVFGGVNRTGTWRIRRRTQALALFGGIDLDLRNAVFEDNVVEISGFWCFGGLDIKLPEGMEVRDQVAGVFGGVDVGDLGERQPGAPTLVVKGLALFGGVSIKGPKVSKRGNRHPRRSVDRYQQ